MKLISFVTVIMLFSSSLILSAQEKEQKESDYNFEIVKELPHTMAKDQGRAGTCWSYAAVSFLESEIMRMGHDSVDLSEIYFAYYAYLAKARKYVMRHGTHNFSQGGQAHDVMNVIRQHGLVPENVYPGKMYEGEEHNHSEVVAMLKGMLKSLSKIKHKLPLWDDAVQAVLDVYFGETPEQFEWGGKTITPKEFQKMLDIDPDNYVEITAYQFYPLYEQIDLDVPDNWSSDLYYNVTMEELMQVINHSVENGYTVCWDGDVSEPGFNHKLGFAVLPTDEALEEKSYIYEIAPQKEVTTDLRENTFMSQKSTDDHLMHLIGKSKDGEGNIYYIIKNSWNTDSNDFMGKLHMSAPYVKEKTIAIMVHKDAVPKKIRKKLGF